MRRLFFFVFCFLPINVLADTAFTCIKQLPETFSESDVPASFQFKRALNGIRNYEEEVGGAGWGYSVKYQNSVCEIVIYLYTHGKKKIIESDVQDELTDFDGFEFVHSFQKEIDGVQFSFADGFVQSKDNTDEQTQFLALTDVGNQFLKYRASCRQMNGLDQAANFRLAESFLTKVIQKSLKKITFCLIQSDLFGKNN